MILKDVSETEIKLVLNNYKVKQENGRQIGAMKRLLSTIMIMAILSAFLTGCDGISVSNPGSVKNDLSTTLSAVISSDSNNAAYILSQNGNKIVRLTNGQNANDIVSHIQYEIKDVKGGWGGDASATIQMIVPNMPELVNQEVSKVSASTTDISSAVSNRLSGDFPKKEYDITAELKQIDNHWYLVMNDELSDAVTGGLWTYYKQMEEDTFEQLTGKKSEER